MERLCGIYVITNLVNGKVYVGSSVNIINRFSQHRSGLNKGNHANKYLQRAWNKYKSNSFKFSIVELCNRNKEVLAEREQYWFDYFKYRGAYNATIITKSRLGTKHSEETKKKMKEKRNSKEYHFKHTEETKKKMSALKKGIKFSEEHKRKISLATRNSSSEVQWKRGASNRGKHLSEEHKQHIREKSLGKKMSKEARVNMSKAHKGKPWSSTRRESFNKKKGGVNNV